MARSALCECKVLSAHFGDKLRFSNVSLRSVAQMCRSEVLLRGVEHKSCANVPLRSVVVPQQCRSAVSTGSVVQKRRSKVSLRSVGGCCVAQKNCSESVAQHAQQCSSEVTLRSLAQKCRIAQRCCSEVSLRSVFSSIRSVEQKCRSEVLPTCGRVARTCRSEVSVRSVSQSVDRLTVDRLCRSEAMLRSVDQKCCSEVSLRSVSHRSEVSSRTVKKKCF